MEKYVRHIIEQFASSKGINFAKATSPEYRDLLKEYLENQKKMIKEYNEFLKSHNIVYDQKNCIEIGKSGFDFISKNTSAKVLSLYSNSFKDFDNKRLIEGTFDSYYGRPMIIRAYGDDFKCESPKDLGIDTYVTQNVYSSDSLTNLQNINDNIVVGAFGSNFDMDCDTKINKLNNFRQRLNVPSNIEYDVKDNNYYCVVTNSYKKTR